MAMSLDIDGVRRLLVETHDPEIATVRAMTPEAGSASAAVLVEAHRYISCDIHGSLPGVKVYDPIAFETVVFCRKCLIAQLRAFIPPHEVITGYE